MPIISVFFGIVVRMHYKEHEPGHVHAEHQGQQGKFDFAGEITSWQHPVANGVTIDPGVGRSASGRASGSLGADEGRQPLNRIAPLE